LYSPPKELQVDVLMQMPDMPHRPVACEPVQRPFRAAMADALAALVRERIGRSWDRCIVKESSEQKRRV
jgi:hypothetical protein